MKGTHNAMAVNNTAHSSNVSPQKRPNLTRWRHQMETFSALLALCAGNSLVTGEFPSQRPVTLNFDVFFDVWLNKRLSKQSWGWWFVHHCAHYDVIVMDSNFAKWDREIKRRSRFVGKTITLYSFSSDNRTYTVRLGPVFHLPSSLLKLSKLWDWLICVYVHQSTIEIMYDKAYKPYTSRGIFCI